MELRNRKLVDNMSNTTSSWATVDVDSPPSTPTSARNKEVEKEEEEEEEDLVDDEEDYGDFEDDEEYSPPPPPPPLSEEKEEIDKKGCWYRFLKGCKQICSSILGFCLRVCVRIKSKLTKKKFLAMVPLLLAWVSYHCSSNPTTGTLDENVTAEALETALDEVKDNVIKSVAEELFPDVTKK